MGHFNPNAFAVHSKWIEAFQTSTATSAAVNEEMFAHFRIPETVVTDNDRPALSLKLFLKAMVISILHQLLIILHPMGLLNVL
jgi:hypothetical protein